ncbi:MAG: SDR family oxidoreductase [Opitutales bacterium]
MDLDLIGKRFLVAASSRGLGFGIAQALAAEGASVALGAREEASLRAAAATLAGTSTGSITQHPLDAADATSITAWVDACAEDLGGIDGLVVNAGGPPPGRFDDFDDAAWAAAFELTLMSAVRLIRAVLPTLRAQRGGSILTVTSTSIKEPIDDLLLSNVFRSGVVSLVKSLSRDLAPDGIRVNNLVPGRIDTDRVRSLDEAAAPRSGISIEEQVARSAAAIPLGRYGTIEEFGRAGAFLLSPAAAYLTGTTLLVDGGATRTIW